MGEIKQKKKTEIPRVFFLTVSSSAPKPQHVYPAADLIPQNTQNRYVLDGRLGFFSCFFSIPSKKFTSDVMFGAVRPNVRDRDART